MPLAEGVSAQVRYKPYSTGLIQSNTQPDSSVDPGPTGGQILRRVGSTVKLAKDSYQASEIRTDMQVVDFRHGTRRVTGAISGEFSPGTYFPLFEGAFRATGAAVTGVMDNTSLTSVVADEDTSTITFGSGDPVALGMRKGSIFELAGISLAANANRKFIVLDFGGTSHSTLTVYPSPADMPAELTFTVQSPGKKLFIPSSSIIRRKFAIEAYHEDIGTSRLYTESRVAGFNLGLPASGMSTIEFPFMGRDMELYDSVSDLGTAPFFTNPAAETTTGIFAAVNGLLRVAGSVVGVVTGLTLAMDLTPSSDAVVGQNYVPEVFLGTANVTGQLTAMLEDNTFIRHYLDEDEIEILAVLNTSNDPDSPTVTILIPRVKFSDADVAMQGLGAQNLTIPFQALKYVGTAAGVESTTVQMFDSAAV